jgi:hypothetical protein
MSDMTLPNVLPIHKGARMTVIGLFDSFEIAQNVVTDLVDHGFNRDHISLVSQRRKKPTLLESPTERTSMIVRARER